MDEERIRDHLKRAADELVQLRRAVEVFRENPQELSPKIDPEWVVKVSICTSLQSVYSGMEICLETLLKEVDGFQAKGERFHKEILERAAGIVEGVREPIITLDLKADLEELRSFRHVARKRYAHEVNLIQALENVDRAVKAMPLFISEMNSFLDSIR